MFVFSDQNWIFIRLQKGVMGCTYYRVYKRLETFANIANLDTFELQAAKDNPPG